MWEFLKRWSAGHGRSHQAPARHHVLCRITGHLWQGGYPEAADFDTLRQEGVRWLINLDRPYPMESAAKIRGFHVINVTLPDAMKGRPEPWWQALAAVARAEHDLGEKVYIHCVAGVSRSATLVWLHLVLGGMDRGAARRLIVKANPGALPGDPLIIDEGIIDAVFLLASRSRPQGYRSPS
jgi:hypothetical protein